MTREAARDVELGAGDVAGGPGAEEGDGGGGLARVAEPAERDAGGDDRVTSDTDAVLDALSRGLTQKMLHGAMAELRTADADARRQASSAVQHFFLRKER